MTNDTTTQILSIVDSAISLVKESPDFVYETRSANQEGTCFYVHTDWRGTEPVRTGGCLFGQAILKSGAADLDWLSAHEGGSIASLMEDLFGNGFGFTSPASTELARAQGAQDAGTPWGEVIHYLNEARSILTA